MRRCPVAWWDGERKTGKEATIARGDKRTIVELTPEQIAARQKKREPLNDNPVKATPDGAKVLEVFKEQLAKPHGHRPPDRVFGERGKLAGGLAACAKIAAA